MGDIKDEVKASVLHGVKELKIVSSANGAQNKISTDPTRKIDFWAYQGH